MPQASRKIALSNALFERAARQWSHQAWAGIKELRERNGKPQTSNNTCFCYNSCKYDRRWNSDNMYITPKILIAQSLSVPARLDLICARLDLPSARLALRSEGALSNSPGGDFQA